MEGATKALQEVIDVPVGALHRRQAARVLAGQRLGAGAKEGDKEVLADQGPEGGRTVADDLGELNRRPGERGQPPAPLLIEREEPLLERRIGRPPARSIVE